MRHSKERARKFKPNHRITGGSRPGKPQTAWRADTLVVADAVVEGWNGNDHATDRTMPTMETFILLMNDRLPTWFSDRSKDIEGKNYANSSLEGQAQLLWGRVYKMHYSGSSDGNTQDPETRNTESREHWRRRWWHLEPLHERVRRGLRA